MKRKRIIKLGKRIVEPLELPEEAFVRIPKITLWGKETLLIEGHKGIFECRENRIRLHTEEGILLVEGDRLVLMEFSGDRLYIVGNVERIGYEPR